MMELLGLAFLEWPFNLMGLIIIAFVIGIIVAASCGKAKGGNKILWGLVGFLSVFLLIFWDWIPTKVAHQYYCSKEAGFWVYKTLDQWKQENPGVFETLVETPGVSSRFGDDDNYTDTYSLNTRINLRLKFNGKLPFNRWRHEQQLLDVKTNEVLARYVDFSTSSERHQAGWSGWKFWLYSEHCPDGAVNEDKSGKFLISFSGASK